MKHPFSLVGFETFFRCINGPIKSLDYAIKNLKLETKTEISKQDETKRTCLVPDSNWRPSVC